MSYIYCLTRGTKMQHESFVGRFGEITFVTDAPELRMHDGETLGGTVIPLTEEQHDLYLKYLEQLK